MQNNNKVEIEKNGINNITFLLSMRQSINLINFDPREIFLTCF